MKRQEEPSSFLADEESEVQGQNQTINKEQKQFKALFVKNAILQSKQIGTNICQVMTPVICLIFTYLIKTIAEENLQITFSFDSNPYPYKFNDFEDYDQLNPDLRGGTQYYLLECQEGCNDTFLGVNDGQNRSGMLGNVGATWRGHDFTPDPYFNPEEVLYLDMPFFHKVNTSVNEEAFHRLEVIGTQSFAIIKKGAGKDYIPDGAINYKTLNSQSLQAEIKVDDCRDLEYHRTNGISKNKQYKRIEAIGLVTKITDFTQAYGLLHVLHIVTSSFIEATTPNNVTVGSGFVLMPETDDQNSFVDTIINSVSSLVFPLGLSLLFPVFLYSVVLEKQERLVQMMKMNGLKIRYYWLTFFVFNFVLCLITNLIFFMLGIFALATTFFVKTSTLLLFVVALGWSLAQIGMAAFFQTFLNKSRSANIIGYLISIWTSMIGSTLSLGVYQYPSEYPIILQMFPPFAFGRIFYLMMMECSNGDCYFDIGIISPEMKNCILFLYLGFIFFFGLGAYLFEIIPQEFGVKRSPLFPIYSLKKMFSKKATMQIDSEEDPFLRDYISEHEEDSFSKAQRRKVLGFRSEEDQQAIKAQYPLIINNMRKLYQKQGLNEPYPAVRSFNLAIAKNQTFGLLGPNGAGKTTLISMITGMYEPNFGNAWIGGYDIRSSIEKAQLEMGVCPQFDLVWPQMSVEEHLYFYARLKGIPQNLLKSRVESSIEEVKLTKFAKFAAKQLSGGMKRRLSVAISLVGDPKIVFLDEPSTGLDPDNRRQLWAVLAECQNKRAIFITTHMMEEADTLCNRIGIITSGVLRTIETPMKLKKHYGEGYDIAVNTVKEDKVLVSRESLHMSVDEEGDQIMRRSSNPNHEEHQDVRRSIEGLVARNSNQRNSQLSSTNMKIAEFMKKQFPGTYLNKCFNGYLIFKTPSSYKISELFEAIKVVEKELGFSDISITNSSLENVFMNVVGKFDANESKEYPKKLAIDSIMSSGSGSPRKIKMGSIHSSSSKRSQNQNPNSGDQSSKIPSIEESNRQSHKADNMDSIISKKRESVMSDEEPVKPNNSKPNYNVESVQSDENGWGEQNDDRRDENKQSKGASDSDYF